jgi:hypothetical protein
MTLIGATREVGLRACRQGQRGCGGRCGLDEGASAVRVVIEAHLGSLCMVFIGRALGLLQAIG